MVQVVNVIGSGSLNVELDLEKVSNDVGEQAEYDPDNYPGMYLRFNEDSPLITVYRTGKYITTGATSDEETYNTRTRFLNLLHEMEIISDAEDNWFKIQNYVCTAELGENLNLNALTIGFGLENTEYEPEQFPGLIYRPQNQNCVVLLFASGRIVITGSPDLDTAEKAFNYVSNKVTEILGNSL